MATLEEKALAVAFFIWAAVILVSLSVVGGLIYVAAHFIHKIW